MGDNCVQLGNRTDNTRQAAIILSAYNNQYLDSGISAPSLVQYQGINDYNLSNHRLNVISQSLNEFRGGYYNNNGKNIETLISESATTLDGKITTLNGTVTSHTQSISNLQQTDNEIKSTVSANTTSIGTLSDRLDTVSGTVSGNTTEISTLKQTASGITSTVSSLSNSVNTLSNNVNSLSGTVSTNTSNISTLQQTASGLSSTVSSHSTSISALSNNVNTVSGSVSTLSNTVTSHTSSISSLQQTASGLNSTVSSHTTKINSLSGTVATNTSNISSMQTQISQLPDNITLSASKVNLGGNKTLDSMLTVSSSNITMTTQEVVINGPNTKGIVRMKNANDNEVITLNTNSSYPTITVNNPNNTSYSTIDPTQIETTNGTVKARLLSTSTPKLRLQNGNYYFEIELDSSGRVWMGGNCSFPNSSQQKSKYLFRNGDDYIEWSS